MNILALMLFFDTLPTAKTQQGNAKNSYSYPTDKAYKLLSTAIVSELV
jgi:hypothetical protein